MGFNFALNMTKVTGTLYEDMCTILCKFFITEILLDSFSTKLWVFCIGTCDSYS